MNFFASSSFGVRMPAGLPIFFSRFTASSSAACTSGWPQLPMWPNEADRSFGPMNTPSMPSTEAIASI